MADILNNLGIVYEAQAQYPEAISAYEEAKQIILDVHGSEHPDVIDILNSLGNIYQQEARYPEAIAAYMQLKQIRTVANGPEDLSIIVLAWNCLAGIYKLQARYTDAIEALEEAKLIKIAMDGSEHPSVADALSDIGQVLIEQGRYEEARVLFKKAIRVYERTRHPNQEKARSCLVVSYIREGNFFMLQDNKGTDRASSCYHIASPSLDPKDPEVQQTLANQFYTTNQLPAVLEHYRILIRLMPNNSLAYHNLACFVHVRACLEQSKGEHQQALIYIKEANGYFERAIELNTSIGVCTEYAHFIWKNRSHYDCKKIIVHLQRAINLEQRDDELTYGCMERCSLDQYIQSLLNEENQLSIKAFYLAHYLLIQVYCVTNQLLLAEDLYRDFKAMIMKDAEAYELTQINQTAESMELIEAAPEQEAEILELLQEQCLANEKLQRQHTKLVAGAQAAIEQCILFQQPLLVQNDDLIAPTPRLLRDSPILSRETASKTLSQDKVTDSSLNQNF